MCECFPSQSKSIQCNRSALGYYHIQPFEQSAPYIHTYVRTYIGTAIPDHMTPATTLCDSAVLKQCCAETETETQQSQHIMHALKGYVSELLLPQHQLQEGTGRFSSWIFFKTDKRATR